MGAWGVNILEDDTALDVYDDYTEMFDEGHDHNEIRTQLQKLYKEYLQDPDDAPLFWLGLAQAQWECGEMDPYVLEQVRSIVEGRTSLNRWISEGSPLAGDREKVLDDFLLQIQKPATQPRKRVALPGS